MEIAKELPANMFIAHFKARIYYEGLKNRCFYCKSETHLKADCPKLAASKTGSVSTVAQNTSGASASFSHVLVNAAIGATADLGRIPTVMTTLPVKNSSRSVRETQKTLPTVSELEHTTTAKELAATADEEKETEEIEETAGSDAADEVEMDADKAILKRTISSGSSESDQSKKKKRKPKTKAMMTAPDLSPIEAIGRRTREQTASTKEKV